MDRFTAVLTLCLLTPPVVHADEALDRFLRGPDEPALRSGGPTADDAWGAEFGQGTDGPVYALTSVSATDLVVGGDFTHAGNVTCNSIARWDGDGWHALGAGANGVVMGLVRHDGDLYAGGTFTSMDGLDVGYVARYDGTTWSALGGGLDGAVYDVASYDGDLYVTGTFVVAGGTPAPYIARWDGAAWHDVSGGLDLHGWDFQVVGANLYVIGAFGQAGGVSSPRAACWDGSSWSSLGSGPGLVDAFCGADFGGDLVVSGWGGVKRWTGTDWEELAGLDDWVYAMHEYGGDLYAGGYFQNGPDGAMRRLARWDGTSWVAVDYGADRLVRAMTEVDGDLYVGGLFSKLQGAISFDYILADHVARFDGTTWSSVGQGSDLFIYTALDHDGDLVVGGEFSRIGGTVTSNIAAWDGTSWSALGDGIDGSVFHLEHFGGDLIAAGDFTTAGGVPARSVARWDGTQWHAMGDGLDGGSVAELIVHGSRLYATGYFTTSGATPAKFVATWNGTTWAEVGGGFDTGGASLAIYDGDLIAAGNFNVAGGTPASKVARWDGTSWHALGAGCDSFVYEVESYDGRLIAGGRFAHAGGVPASCLAAWDGTSWSSIGPAVSGLEHPGVSVHGMSVRGDELFVGGRFTFIGGTRMNGVARYDGTTWHAMGSGVEYRGEGRWGYVWDVRTVGDDIYVTGGFDLAGGKSSLTIARWNDADILVAPSTPPSTPITPGLRVGAPVPNPFRAGVTTTLELDHASTVTVGIFDVQGRQVATIPMGALDAGRHPVTWDGRVDGRGAVPSVYYLRIEAGGIGTSTRVVKAR